ncbi:sugar ABC transporter substrate-binding protein [Virgibacillus doumboii]|uniref:sugar ABC transporter substrate-binding protein n=1 Tax=Virgibacillus doumboii TaxID=2697503 RepID=UPI0013DF44BD|nr:sugar ABC transporter substrate-binding protein [Virgibacillus doumboii]
MKRIIFFILLMMFAVVLVGCGSDGGSEAGATDDSNDSDTISVGYAINTLNNPFFVEVKESAEQAAKDSNIELSVVNANSDLAQQMSGIEDLIQQGVDVLIIDPVDSKGSVAAVESANEAGIPVITTGRRIEGGEIVTHMGYDEVKNGETAGKFLAEQLNGKGKVIELQGTLGTDTARLRSEGFNNAMNEYPDIEIVASQSADFDRTQGMKVTENLLQSHPDIKGLYAANDEMGLGALQALQAANKEDVVIVSNDGTDEALNAVKDGDLAGTMAVSPSAYGEKAVEIAIDVAKGEEQPEFIELPSQFISQENVGDALNSN